MIIALKCGGQMMTFFRHSLSPKRLFRPLRLNYLSMMLTISSAINPVFNHRPGVWMWRSMLRITG
ncbi:hypothetical protein KCP71_14375 [Salmonella enterica subsp. enterica]|nr:hypothetical protein KCP71_14375 [Salmonella enterica subsp. enterica]